MVALPQTEQLTTRLSQKHAQAINGSEAKRHQSLAAAFTGDAYDTLVEIDLVKAQGHKLRDTQARGIQNLEHRSIAQPECRGDCRRREQALDLLFGQ